MGPGCLQLPGWCVLIKLSWNAIRKCENYLIRALNNFLHIYVFDPAEKHNLYERYSFSTPYIPEKSETQQYVTLVSQLLYIYFFPSACFPAAIGKPRSAQYQGERLACVCACMHVCVFSVLSEPGLTYLSAWAGICCTLCSHGETENSSCCVGGGGLSCL